MQTSEPGAVWLLSPRNPARGEGSRAYLQPGVGGSAGVAGLSTRPPAASCITVARPSANRGGHRKSHELTKPLPSPLSTLNHVVLPQPLAGGWGGGATERGQGPLPHQAHRAILLLPASLLQGAGAPKAHPEWDPPPSPSGTLCTPT